MGEILVTGVVVGATGLISCGIGRGRGNEGIQGFTSSELDLFELKILSIENARGFAGSGEGWVGKGSRGRGILKNGRNRKGFGIGIGAGNDEGGGEEIVEPDDE